MRLDKYVNDRYNPPNGNQESTKRPRERRTGSAISKAFTKIFPVSSSAARPSAMESLFVVHEKIIGFENERYGCAVT